MELIKLFIRHITYLLLFILLTSPIIVVFYNMELSHEEKNIAIVIWINGSNVLAFFANFLNSIYSKIDNHE